MRSRPRRMFGQAGSSGLGRRPALGDRRVGSRIFVAISGTGRGQRSRIAMTMSNTQSEKISDGAAGASGTAQNARAAAFAAAETGSPSPAQAFRLAARPFGSTSQVEPRRRVGIRAGSRLGGRPARSRQSRSRFAAGAKSSPIGEAEVAQRGCIGVKAQDFGRGRGALKRQASAQRPGGGRICAQTGVQEREPGAGREQGIALPCPSSSPRPGRDRRRRKGLPFRGFRQARLVSRPRRERRGKALLNVRRRLGEEVWLGANHLAMVNRWRRFVSLFFELSAPLVGARGCPIRLLYRT